MAADRPRCVQRLHAHRTREQPREARPNWVIARVLHVYRTGDDQSTGAVITLSISPRAPPPNPRCAASERTLEPPPRPPRTIYAIIVQGNEGLVVMLNGGVANAFSALRQSDVCGKTSRSIFLPRIAIAHVPRMESQARKRRPGRAEDERWTCRRRTAPWRGVLQRPPYVRQLNRDRSAVFRDRCSRCQQGQQNGVMKV